MRARAGFLGGLAVLLIGTGVAWLAYQAGLSQAAATAVATGTTPAVVYGGWGFGFGFFHVFGLLFGLFLLFGVARLFFGLLFWRGPRHWAGREGFGAGFGPGMHGPWGRRAEFFAEMHRQLHEEEARRAAEPPKA